MNHDTFLQISSSRDEHQQASLLSFTALVAAFVAWVVIVVVFFPRWLGRLLSFLINRTASGKYHICIPFLHLYPLGGHIIAHSVIITTPDMCIAVEEMVMQFRWWHVQKSDRVPQPLAIDSPEVFDTVARVQQQIDLENSAPFVWRLWYRLRRFWRQTVSYPDYNIPDETKSLISFVLFGLRVRMVNNQANFNYVQDILALARKSTREQTAAAAPHVELEISDLPRNSFNSSREPNVPSPSLSPLSSVLENVPAQPVEKSFYQQVLEQTSLRITRGSCYICDMGQSPLLQITVDSAKLRYRCGAPACSLDKFRSRIRIGVSSLKISSASEGAVRAVLENEKPSSSSSDLSHDPRSSVGSVDDSSDLMEQTNFLIRCVESEGHRGLSDPFYGTSQTQNDKRGPVETRRRRRSAFVQKLLIFGNGNSDSVKASRKAQTLQCIDILHATTAVFEYVVDEPGLNPEISGLNASTPNFMYHNITNHSTGNIQSPPPPLRQLSILLRGAELTYDFSGISYLWRAVERFQTTLYDYSPYADVLKQNDKRRATAQFQVEIEATPKPPETEGPSQRGQPPLVVIPFSPQKSTWLSLMSTGIADTRRVQIFKPHSDVHYQYDDADKSRSQLDIRCSRLLFRLEASSEDSPQQNVVLDLRDPSVSVNGIVNMPLLRSKSAILTRTAQVPDIWYEEHFVSTELLLSSSEIVYVPDLHRVISDILATSDQYSVKPPAANYSVPYRETIRICANDSYSIVLSCGHDNAWKDILRKEGDEYGKLRLRGSFAELVLSPNIPTQFYGDAYSRSWTLSLPNVVATLEISPGSCQETDDACSPVQSAARDTLRNSRGARPSFSGRKLKTHVEPVSPVPGVVESLTKARETVVEIDLFHSGVVCKIDGKSLFHEGRKYLSSSLVAFPDAANKSEISIVMDEAVVDLNPHHITHILNIVRNYSGTGSHVISTVERTALDSKRRQVAADIYRGNRHPSQEECLILGLSPGYTLSPDIPRSGSDDLISICIDIDFVLVRLHDLPHAATQFDFCSRNIHSVSTDKLCARFHGTRLGSEFKISSDPGECNLSVRMGCLPMERDTVLPNSGAGVESLPKAVLGNFQIQKVSVASEGWGSFFSTLKVSGNYVSGCLPDYAVDSLKRIGVSFIPHPTPEHISSVAVLLSVDNIEVSLDSVDLLLLSSSGESNKENCPQINSYFPAGKGTPTPNLVRSVSAHMPHVLAGVTHVYMCDGLRVVSSTLESENQGLVSRIFFPSVSADVVVPSDRISFPWIDEPSLRAHIAQAGVLNESQPRGLLWNTGSLVRAASVSEIIIDLVFASKSSSWSEDVALNQSIHVLTRHLERGIVKLPWCTGRPLRRVDDTNDANSQKKHRRSFWWDFITNFKLASIVSKCRGHSLKGMRKDLFSARVLTPTVVDISPEFFMFVYDVLARSDDVEGRGLSSTHSYDPNDVLQWKPSIISQELITMWHKFEKLQPPKWAGAQKRSSTSSYKKALEMNAFKLRFFCSVVYPKEQWTLFFSGSRDEKWVYLNLPLGFHVLIDDHLHPIHNVMPEQNSIEGSLQKFIRTNVLHFSTSVATFGCNGMDLGAVTDLLFLSHERNSVSYAEAVEGLAGESGRRDRGTLVVKLGAIKFGDPTSSLDLYANVGLVMSVFFLLSRAIVIQTNILANKHHDKTASLLKLLSCPSLFELTQKDPAQVRVAFVKLLDQIQSIQKDERRVGPLTESDFRFIRSSTFRKRNTVPLQSDVRSLDISLQTFSFVIAQKDTFCFNNFTCKGGKTSSTNSVDLGGYVLNASFGKILLSVRDDVAAGALQTVSEVASMLGCAARNIPAFRHMYQYHNQNEMTPCEFSRNEANATPHHFQSSNSIRNSNSLCGPSSYMINLGDDEQFQNQFFSSSSFRDLNQKSKSAAVLTTRKHDSRVQLLDRVSSPQSDSHFRSQEQNGGNYPPESFAGESIPNPPPRLSAAPSSLFPSSRVTLNSDVNYHAPFRPFQPERRGLPNSGRSSTDEGYLHVSVRTAGDTGPPRKRSKCMVPVTSSFTLPFPSSDSQAEPRNTLRSINSVSRSWNPSTPKNSPRRTINRSQNKILNSATLSRSSSYAIAGGNRRGGINDRLELTLFVSCHEIMSRYYRRCGKTLSKDENLRGNIEYVVHGPKLTFMLQPLRGMSFVFTAMSSELFSSTNPTCKLCGSIAQTGVMVSITQPHRPSNLPKLIVSSRISNCNATLQATDLQSVLQFRGDFKKDVLSLATAFVSSKQSLSELARAINFSSTTTTTSLQNRSSFSTLAFDILFEESEIELTGFHPRDSNMAVSYVLGGMFFSLAAVGNDNAALTSALRIYDHGLRLSSPSWPSNELFSFPSLDACGVQWAEKVKLPTFFKVSTKPLVSLTSFQGLRHVLFTVAGLLAFQNTPTTVEKFESCLSLPNVTPSQDQLDGEANADGTGQPLDVESSPFAKSILAWERTKGVQMDISICPLALSLASGQVVAQFRTDAVTGILEWNKLVFSGVQLRTTINVPKVSLAFMKMPTTDFNASDIKFDGRRVSLSIALEKAKVDVLKSQKELTHTFVFRTIVGAVSGQVRPWKLLLDAAVWADEQEFVSDLQSIDYSALSASRPRPITRAASVGEHLSTEHRLILFGASIEKVILAIPLLSSEQPTSSRLAVRATDLHLFARHRFHNISVPTRNIFQIKSRFIGILWENSSLLSSHHTQVTVGIEAARQGTLAHFGKLNLVLNPGTWRICPRKDVVVAIIDAKNRRDNRVNEYFWVNTSEISGTPLAGNSSLVGDTASNAVENENRLLVENLQLKIHRASGFIEGLDEPSPSHSYSQGPLEDPTSGVTKVSVPAFSISVIRDSKEDFDLVDFDFSGREGEFPRNCLRRVSSLFSDMMGLVASDQERVQKGEVATADAPVQQPREVSRNVSVLVRFGGSLYRAQEEVYSGIESRVCFSARRSSTLLVSVTKAPVLFENCRHTTVITGVSPKLTLELTPVLEGADVQSLRLIDGRFLFGVCPCHSPHSAVHINRVVALTELKTILLLNSRIRQERALHVNEAASLHELGPKPRKVPVRRVVLYLGKPRTKRISTEKNTERSRRDPDIHLQLRLSARAKDSEVSFIDLAVERAHFEAIQSNSIQNDGSMQLTAHSTVHDVILRGKWDILNFKLRLREHLFCLSKEIAAATRPNRTFISNIINRLDVESLQYQKHTLKLNVDALAAMWMAPPRNVTFESTIVYAEVSYTLRKVITKIFTLWKKLENEVKLAMEREAKRKSVASGNGLTASDGTGNMSALEWSEQLQTNSTKEKKTESSSNSESNSSGSNGAVSHGPLLDWQPSENEEAVVSIRGDEVTIMMRGYQFDETRHSAVVSLLQYSTHYTLAFQGGQKRELHYLKADFQEMSMSYNDDVRRIRSELFKIPEPKLRLTLLDTDDGFDVKLIGDLEIRLGHGFYNWQEFRELLVLTVCGITPAPPRSNAVVELIEPVLNEKEQLETWEKRRVNTVNVELHPKIDVIGDLTADVLPMLARLKSQVDAIPRYMYGYIILPLESLSRTLCHPLEETANAVKSTGE